MPSEANPVESWQDGVASALHERAVMNASRARYSLLSLLAALGLMMAPLSAHAGSARPKAPASSTGAPKRTRSEAARAGWETRAMKAKADANWGARVAKNPALKGDTVAEAKFKAQSVRAQKQAAKRKPATTAKKPKPVSLAKPKRVAAAAEELAAEAPDANELDDGVDLDGDELEESEPRRGGGIVDRVRSYIAARRVFKQMTDAHPDIRGEFTRLSRLNGASRNGVFLGAGGLLATVSIISGGTLAALIGLGAAGTAGTRLFVNNNRARREIVGELAAAGQLEPDEIAVYEAAGWL